MGRKETIKQKACELSADDDSHENSSLIVSNNEQRLNKSSIIHGWWRFNPPLNMYFGKQ